MKLYHVIRIKEHEARKSQRINMPLKVKWNWSAKKGILEEIFTEDISGGGIRIRANKPFHPGDLLKTHLYFPEDPRPIRTLSRVVWCRRPGPSKDAFFDIGIKHVKIDPKDKARFIFLFCETMINSLIPA